MSESLDLVRSIVMAWERGDWSSNDWADAEIEFNSVEGPEPGSWRGRAAMASAWAAFLTAWRGYRVEAQEYRQLEDDRVLVLNRVLAEGRTSGFAIGQESGASGLHAIVFWVRSGKVVRLDSYWHRERAFADLGLKG